MSEALVDPHVHPELPGSSPDSSGGEDGVNYLRRLKKEVAPTAPVDAEAKGNPKVAPAGNGFVWKERRRTPRVRCSGSVEFRAEGSEARMWGTLTDISMGGCYVEMNNTFPVGTKVNLILKSCGFQVQAPGEVRTSYPFLGMGICFTEIEIEQRGQLKQLLDTLIGRGAAFSDGSSQAPGMPDTMGPADPQAFIEKMTEFFQKHASLSRAEFYEMAKWVRRS